MPRLARVRWALPLLGTALLAACGNGGDPIPQDTLAPEGPAARTIDNLINPVFIVAGVVFVLVMALCVFVPLKFRAKGDETDDELPEQVHGKLSWEIGWTATPAAILLIVGAFTIKTIFDLSDQPPADAVAIEVIGHQWWWEYRYDTDRDGQYDDLVTANDMVIPAGEKVDLTITSRDVIHSFWVPKLNGKRDAVPGRHHPLWIEADEPGEWVGQCTEYCGLSHAEMRIKAVALTRQDYDAWVEKMSEPAETFAEDDTSLAAEGYRVFTGQLCASCHVINGVNDDDEARFDAEGRIQDPQLQVSGHAPNLTKLMTRTTFAGAKFDLRKDTAECRALGLTWAEDDDNREKCLNRSELESWLRNPPAQKAMASVAVEGRTGIRGMPNLNLSEQQIDQLVAYLETLQ